MQKASRRFRKGLSVFLCLMLMGTVIVPYAAAETETNFVIENPYEDVDWDTWDAYKTQLHCHTTASDGFLTIKELIQASYDLGYDIVAVTDHGTINKGWDTAPDLIPLVRLVKYERTKMAPVVPLTAEEYQSYLDGTAKTTNGTVRTNGMLDVPQGIELNMATPFADCHLTGYFSDYGQGLAGVYGDYETPSKGVMDAGGISMLAHVGEYVYQNHTADQYVGQKVDEYYVNKFARIFLDCQGSSVGMGINSAFDDFTRCDRILYDQILQKTIPNGVVPWGFTFSDSHTFDTVNEAYTMMMMPTFDLDAFRSSMENGQFFSVSHHSFGVELNGMEEIPGYDHDKVDNTRNDTPMVTKIEVDEENDVIRIEGINFNMITWVSNGNVIKRETDITDGKAEIDLHASDLLDDPELFLRFYIVGDAGICYANPMVLHVEGEDFEPVDVPETHDISTALRDLVTFLDDLIFRHSMIVRLFKKFALGYDPWA